GFTAWLFAHPDRARVEARIVVRELGSEGTHARNRMGDNVRYPSNGLFGAAAHSLALMAGKKTAAKKRRAPRRKAKAGSSGIEVLATMPEGGPEGIGPLKKKIADEGGVVVGAYLDPLGGQPLILSVLPIDKIEPTPFQRDLSDTHHKRLADV